MAQEVRYGLFLFSFHSLTYLMTTSSNGNIFLITGLLCGVGNSPITGEFPAQRPVMRSFDAFFICAWINSWVNNHEANDLRCHCDHCNVTVMHCNYHTVCNTELWFTVPIYVYIIKYANLRVYHQIFLWQFQVVEDWPQNPQMPHSPKSILTSQWPSFPKLTNRNSMNNANGMEQAPVSLMIFPL